MAKPRKLDQKDFDDIYSSEVIDALKNDRELDFQSINAKSMQKGICPKCGKRRLFISVLKPWVLMCNRENNCQFTEKTRERYSYLFENLSERFPKTPQNPNATADAYLQRNRGFDIGKLSGWYEQGSRKLPNDTWADTVRFTLVNGYWERLIDAKAVELHEGKKAHVKYGTDFQGKGWIPPGMTLDKGDRIYVV